MTACASLVFDRRANNECGRLVELKTTGTYGPIVWWVGTLAYP